jgi:hypothetical protein
LKMAKLRTLGAFGGQVSSPKSLKFGWTTSKLSFRNLQIWSLLDFTVAMWKFDFFVCSRGQQALKNLCLRPFSVGSNLPWISFFGISEKCQFDQILEAQRKVEVLLKHPAHFWKKIPKIRKSLRIFEIYFS